MSQVLEKKQERVEDIITERKKKIAFLDLLLQMRLSDGSGLSNSDIQEEVDTFMFEGHDTTTCSIAWTIFLIGLYPQVIHNLIACRLIDKLIKYDNLVQKFLRFS